MLFNPHGGVSVMTYVTALCSTCMYVCTVRIYLFIYLCLASKMFFYQKKIHLSSGHAWQSILICIMFKHIYQIKNFCCEKVNRKKNLYFLSPFSISSPLWITTKKTYSTGTQATDFSTIA